MADDEREDRDEKGREGKESMKKKKLSGSENRNAKKKRLLVESAKGCKSMHSFFGKKTSNTEATRENEQILDRVDESRSESIEVTRIEDDDVAADEVMVELYQSKTVQEQLEVAEEHQESATTAVSTATSSKESEACRPIESRFIPVKQDVSFFLQKKDISVEELRVGLLDHWRPKKQEDCPTSYDGSAKCKRRVSLALLQEEDEWLAVSKADDHEGLWCKVCTLMTHSDVTRGQKMGFLVSKPLKNFKKLYGKDGYITQHKASQFHALNMERKKEFLQRTATAENPKDALSLMYGRSSETRSRNRAALQSIIKLTMLCGQQNISLRGHRDDGEVLSKPSHNDGNFRALIRYTVEAGDEKLGEHLKKAPKNASYVSKTTQNEILSLSTDLIKERIVFMVKEASYYSIIADETTDRAKRELITIALRFAHDDGSKVQIHEMPFVVLDLLEAIKEIKKEEIINADEVSETQSEKVIEEVKMSGENIGKVILREISRVGLDLSFCVGQGYDGASAMSSEQIGAAATVKKVAPLADYFHCASHCLNLSASKTLKVLPLSCCLDTVKKVVTFFQSAKRNKVLLESIALENNDQRKRKLIKLCTTRFVERHQAILCFADLLPHILAALDAIQDWDDKTSAVDAKILQNNISDFEFVVALEVLTRMSSHLLILSKSLQTVGKDLAKALQEIDNVIKIIEEERANVDEAFASLYGKVLERAELLSIQEAKPRTAQRSRHRANVLADGSAEDYFKVNMFIPMLDHVLLDMKSRFGRQQKLSMKLGTLIPAFIANAAFDELLPAIEKYEMFLSDEATVNAEFRQWQMQ